MKEIVSFFEQNGVSFFIRNGWLYTSVKALRTLNKEKSKEFVDDWNKKLNRVRMVINLETNNFKIQEKI